MDVKNALSSLVLFL